jgi:predicted lipid-binding transport protein (Tim44 family)
LSAAVAGILNGQSFFRLARLDFAIDSVVVIMVFITVIAVTTFASKRMRAIFVTEQMI